MKRSAGMILAGIAAALQTVAVLLAVLMTVWQSTVKQIYGCEDMVCGVNTVPTGAFAELLLQLPVYVAFLLCIVFVRDKRFAGRVLAIAFAAVAVLFKGVTALLGFYVNMLQARMKGALAYAAYCALNNAVLQVTFLFTVTAFALFCMAAGSCLSDHTEI